MSMRITHKEVLEDVLIQFHSYPSTRCKDCHLPDNMKKICQDKDLYCQKKLLESAEELDNE